jgi:beta-mannosidase
MLAAMEHLSLAGTWRIRSTDGRYELDAQMPGSLMQALESRGEFGAQGVFYRENNRKCLAAADNDFVFTRRVSIPAALLAVGERRLYLEADGLDTLATLSVNGTGIGKADNMHRRWRFDVTDRLKAGENEVSIAFANSLEHVRRVHPRRNLWHAYWNQPDYAFPGFNAIRKSHCSYGWDWGPIIPDVGIWRDIRIAACDGARLSGVHVVQEHKHGNVTLVLTPELEVWGRGRFALRATLTHPDGSRQTAEVPLAGATRLAVDRPELWWPNGLGEPGPRPLYKLEVALLREGRAEQAISLQLGLRTLTVRRETDQWGETFAFECNGLPVFARGGDYIPEDVFLTRVTRERTDRLLADAARANFNCIRVWGGGVYPSEDFFDLCDSYGLVVWQDLMFACALYDMDDPAFADNIAAEARDNLERIRHRASLGLVCGNNEMEQGFEEWGFPHTKHNRAEYLKQYQFLFAGIAAEVCPEVFYWPASPSSGGDFEAPNSPDRGDCHFWDVWHKNVDFSEYKKHYFRFMSEFGFESFPSTKTIRTFTTPEDLDIFSPVMEDHQRCLGGNGKILGYIARYFRYPRDFESLVYVSQCSQADALRHGIEHWRRNRGRCMGSVYWQLNDNWPVASWSSIDYYGRWKALHYVAARSYDNVLVSCDGDERAAALHVSNEGAAAVSGTLRWSLLTMAGRVVESGGAAVAVDPFASREITRLDFGGRAMGHFGREHLLSYRLEIEGGDSRHGIHCFAPYKALALQPPALTRRVEPKGDRIAVTVRAERPALFVEIELAQDDRVFSDNYFALDGQEERTVFCEAAGLDAQGLERQLRLRSLYDASIR